MLADHLALTLTGALVLVAFCSVLLLVASALLMQLALRMRPDKPVESLHRPWMTENKAEKGDSK